MKAGCVLPAGAVRKGGASAWEWDPMAGKASDPFSLRGVPIGKTGTGFPFCRSCLEVI